MWNDEVYIVDIKGVQWSNKVGNQKGGGLDLVH
jgi:hypothetical protein